MNLTLCVAGDGKPPRGTFDFNVIVQSVWMILKAESILRYLGDGCVLLCHNRLDREPTCLGDIRVHYIGICDPSSPSRLEPVVIKGFLSALSSVWKERKITSAWAQSGGCFGNCTGLPGITCVRACHALSPPENHSPHGSLPTERS